MAKRTREEDEAVRPGLPDDIIRLILALIPTKSAFCISLLSKQFESAWCSGPVIDLDEGKPQANLDGVVNFTNVLKRYLKFRTESKELHPADQSLHKFRLRMAMNPVRQDILEELLNCFAKERSLRELDLSCLTKLPRRLSFQTLLNINSLTSLSLDYVSIKDDVTRNSAMGLPFLKTLSFKNMQVLDNLFLIKLISSCSSIEYLSLTSCSFDLKSRHYVFLTADCTTLKYLEMRDCKFGEIHVSECVNLETFILVSESPEVKQLMLHRCHSLKNIYIREKQLKYIQISSDTPSPCVKATVNTPKLISFTFNYEEMKDKCVDGRLTELYPKLLAL